MKKLLALLLAALLVLSMVACAAKTETPAAEAPAAEAPAAETPAADTPAAEAPAEGKIYDGVEITMIVPIWYSEDEDLAAWNAVVAPFCEQTGLTVNFNMLGYGDLITTQMSNLIAGEAADILAFGGGSEYDFWINDFLMCLDDCYDEDLTSYWKCWDLKAMADGKHYLVPFAGGFAPRPIAINLTLAKELGIEPPADDKAFTWEYLIENAKKAVEAGHKGYVTPFSGNENALITNYFNYVNQAGGSLDNADGMWDFTTPEALEAMTFINDLFNTHGIVDTVTYDMDATYAAFLDGDALFSAGNVTWFTVNEENMPFEFALYQMYGKTGACFTTADSFGVNNASEHKDAAAALLGYVMGKEGYPNLLDTWILAESDNASTVEWQPYPEIAQHLMDQDNAYLPPVAPGSQQIKDALQTHQQLVALGQETPADALAAVQAVADEVQQQ